MKVQNDQRRRHGDSNQQYNLEKSKRSALALANQTGVWTFMSADHVPRMDVGQEQSSANRIKECPSSHLCFSVSRTQWTIYRHPLFTGEGTSIAPILRAMAVHKVPAQAVSAAPRRAITTKFTSQTLTAPLCITAVRLSPPILIPCGTIPSFHPKPSSQACSWHARKAVRSTITSRLLLSWIPAQFPPRYTSFPSKFPLRVIGSVDLNPSPPRGRISSTRIGGSRDKPAPDPGDQGQETAPSCRPFP